MRKSWVVLLLGVCFFVNVNAIFAQPRTLNKALEDSIYQKAILMLDFTESTDNQLVADEVAMQQVIDLLGYGFTEVDSLEELFLNEKMKAIKKDFGLSFSARYTHNGERADEVLEPGTRWRAGVEWDVLNDGFFDKKRKSKAVEDELQLHELESDLRRRNSNYPFIYNKIIHAGNQQKIELLHQRIPYLESLLEILTDLYYIHDVKYTEVLDVKKKVEESKALLTTYEKFNHAFTARVQQDTLKLDASKFPILNIDIDKLLNDTIYEQLINKMVDVKKEAIQNRDANVNLPNLKLFGNYNLRTRTFEYDRSYTSFGASFSMPIDFNKKEKRMSNFLEGELIQQKADNQVYNNTRELLNLYQEYNYKMKQYIAFLHNKARLEELLRVERVLLNYDRRGHSPLSALNYQDMILAVDMELLDIQQMMYLNLAKIVTKSHHVDFMSCLSIRNFEEVGKKLEGVRYVYLTKLDLQENFTFITNYLEKNEFKSVILEEKIPIEYYKKFGDAGILALTIYDPIFTTLEIERVPIRKFDNRNHLEFWISSARRAKPKSVFLFESFGALVELDKRNKQISKR